MTAMRNVWVIAKNTFSQAIRMKLALTLFVMLLLLLPLMSKELVGDGTLTGKLQTFTSYSLSLLSLLLSFLIITISCYSLATDIKEKLIFGVVTKPVARFQIVLGKFVGIVMFGGVMLVIFSGVIYALTLAMPKFGDVPDEQIEEARQSFFTARTGIKPQIDRDKIMAEAQQQYERLKEQGMLPEGKNRQELINEFRGQKFMQAMSVEPGAAKSWKFYNVKPASRDDFIYVRFKYEVSVSPPDNSVSGRWVVGDLRKFEAGEGGASDIDTPIYDSYVRKDSVKNFHEIKIPAQTVAEDGYIEVAFQNMYYNNTTVIPKDVEVLFESGGFSTNYFMATVLIFVRLIFLAALGVSLSTWLSFPVAIFACLVVFFTGMINGFIVDAIDMLSKEANVFYALTVRPVLALLPRFDGQYNPTPQIISARLIGWGFLFKAIAITAILKSGLLMLAGIYIFSKREIAKVTV
jgi:hypothetical protein